MPRTKKKDDTVEGGMSRFLPKQDDSEESPPRTSDSEEAFITSLKDFIKGEFPKVRIEVKDIDEIWGVWIYG